MGLRATFLWSAVLLAIGSTVITSIVIRHEIEKVEKSVAMLNTAGQQRLLIGSVGGRVLKSLTVGDPQGLLQLRDEIRDELFELESLALSLYGHGELNRHLPASARDDISAHYASSMQWEYEEFFAAMHVFDERISSHLWNQYQIGQPAAPGDFDPSYPPFSAFIADDDAEMLAVFQEIERALISGLMNEVNTSLGLIETGLAESIDHIEQVRLQANGIVFASIFYLGIALFFTHYRPMRTMARQLGEWNESLDKQVIERTEEVNRQRAGLQAILDSALDGIISIDSNSNIEIFNPAAEDIFGYSQEELIGRNVRILMPENYRDTHDSAVTHYYATGERRVLGNRTEVEGLRKDGAKIPLELSVNEVKIGDESSFTGVLRDITDRKKAESELRQAMEQALQANEAKSAFLATMSHELRTPLNAIIGFSDLLKMEAFGPLNEKQAEFVETVTRSGSHLLSLINDVLDLSRVESGQTKVNQSDFNAGETILQTVHDMQPLAERSKISIVSDIQGLYQPAYGDEEKIRQILVNLLANSIKFTQPEGTLTVTGRIIPKGELVSHRGGVLQITVKDTGIGFESLESEKLFESFYQADSSYARAQEGTGLGLPLSRRLARLHHGELTIESEGRGKGARAVLEIPLLREQRPESVLRDEQPDDEQLADDVKKYVLVVDDQRDARSLVSAILGVHGFEVVEAENGNSVVEQAIALKPVAITLDLMMPGVNGFQVLENLQQHAETRDIPVIVLTNKDLSAEERGSLAENGYSTLRKSTDSMLIASELLRNGVVMKPRKKTDAA